MIARRMSDHAASSFRLGQTTHRIVCPTKFECAGLLQIFALKEQPGLQHAIQRFARHHRSTMCQGRNASGRLLNIRERGNRNRHGIILSALAKGATGQESSVG
jgi:hypothetical protein